MNTTTPSIKSKPACNVKYYGKQVYMENPGMMYTTGIFQEMFLGSTLSSSSCSLISLMSILILVWNNTETIARNVILLLMVIIIVSMLTAKADTSYLSYDCIHQENLK